MSEKFHFEVGPADEKRLLPIEKQREWMVEVPFHEGELTLLGSDHTFVNNPEAITSSYSAACFETAQSDVLDLYLSKELKEFPEYESRPEFGLSVPTALNKFADGQYRLVLKKLIESETRFYFATDSAGGTGYEYDKEEIKKMLAILAAPPAVATLTAAVNKLRGEVLLSRRNFLRGTGALALSTLIFSELDKSSADPKDDWFFPQFANKVREIIMSLKVEYVHDLMKSRGVDKPKILFAVGVGHVRSLKHFFSIPRSDRVAYVRRVIEVLRSDYGEIGEIIATEFEKTATVPEMSIDPNTQEVENAIHETHHLTTNKTTSYVRS